MKTYRVTVVRSDECEVIVEAKTSSEAKEAAYDRLNWHSMGYRGLVNVEVVGEPEEINEGS